MTQAQQPVVDKKEQLEKIEAYAIPGETILAVFDLKGAGTGFLGLTDRRLIFYDKGFLQRYKAMVTIPYSKITVLASQDEEGILTRGRLFGSSKLAISAGHDQYEFEFRGAEKAHLAYQVIAQHLS